MTSLELTLAGFVGIFGALLHGGLKLSFFYSLENVRNVAVAASNSYGTFTPFEKIFGGKNSAGKNWRENYPGVTSHRYVPDDRLLGVQLSGECGLLLAS